MAYCSFSFYLWQFIQHVIFCYTTFPNVYSLNISKLEINFKSLGMYKDPLILLYITVVYQLVINMSFKNLPFICQLEKQWYHLAKTEL